MTDADNEALRRIPPTLSSLYDWDGVVVFVWREGEHGAVAYYGRGEAELAAEYVADRMLHVHTELKSLATTNRKN